MAACRRHPSQRLTSIRWLGRPDDDIPHRCGASWGRSPCAGVAVLERWLGPGSVPGCLRPVSPPSTATVAGVHPADQSGPGDDIPVAVIAFPVQDGRLLMPIDPVQILWVNLVVAITLALPLAFEAPEPDLMRRPPRAPDAPLLRRFLVVAPLPAPAKTTALSV